MPLPRWRAITWIWILLAVWMGFILLVWQVHLAIRGGEHLPTAIALPPAQDELITASRSFMRQLDKELSPTEALTLTPGQIRWPDLPAYILTLEPVEVLAARDLLEISLRQDGKPVNLIALRDEATEERWRERLTAKGGTQIKPGLWLGKQ